MSLPSWAPAPKELPRVVAALGCAPVETLWHPQRYAVALLEDEAAVRAVDPDFRALAREGDLLTIVTAPGDETDIVSRAFAPGAGIDEDPVTGSAHAVLTPYWAARLGRDRFTAFQASRRGGRLTCRLDGDRVVLGGRCVTVIEGVMRL
jgi:predicted PhzF superfamily epimerase YddE/YHI9